MLAAGVSANSGRGQSQGHGTVVEPRTSPWSPVALSFTVGLLGSVVYSSRAAWSGSWAPVLGSVYYIPIVISALTMSLRSALTVALAAGTVHTIAAILGHADSWVGPVLQTVLFVSVALICAKVAQSRARNPTSSAGSEQQEEVTLAVPEPFHDSTESGTLNRVLVGMVRPFRTPVTSIEGAGWVLDDPAVPDEKRRELVGIIRREAHWLSRILSDVMEFSQPRRPRLRMVDIAALLDDVIQLESRNDAASQCVFTNNIPPTLRPVRADPEQIRQVLLNLINNSIQALRHGGHIEVAAQADDHRVTITVKDDGPGIPAAAVGRIFEPFFSTHERSLGLGLPAALRIVREHGGSISVDAHGNRGTSISVVLPAAAAKHNSQSA